MDAGYTTRDIFDTDSQMCTVKLLQQCDWYHPDADACLGAHTACLPCQHAAALRTELSLQSRLCAGIVTAGAGAFCRQCLSLCPMGKHQATCMTTRRSTQAQGLTPGPM